MHISLKFVRKSKIDYKLSLVHTKTWHQRCKQALFEPMMTKFMTEYMGEVRHCHIKGSPVSDNKN